MPTLILYVLIATFFAWLTSVLAKFGIQKINSDLGLAIRTAVVLLIVTANVIYWKGTRDLSQLTPKTTSFLLLSGVNTSLSWIFYYRAMP